MFIKRAIYSFYLSRLLCTIENRKKSLDKASRFLGFFFSNIIYTCLFKSHARDKKKKIVTKTFKLQQRYGTFLKIISVIKIGAKKML